MKKIRIERDGEALWPGRSLQEAVAAGHTLDQALLRDGDQIVIAKRKDGGFQGQPRIPLDRGEPGRRDLRVVARVLSSP